MCSFIGESNKHDGWNRGWFNCRCDEVQCFVQQTKSFIVIRRVGRGKRWTIITTPLSHQGRKDL